MSTRSIIVITGSAMYSGSETVRLYKHSDGYPSGNLPIIAEALANGKRLLEQYKETRPLNVEAMLGLMIGAATSIYGMGAKPEETYREEFKPEHLGDQGDLEWIYLIDLEERTVQVYGGGFSGDLPQRAYEKGVVDPLYTDPDLQNEYRVAERKEIERAIEQIEAQGFRVNPDEAKVRKMLGAGKRKRGLCSKCGEDATPKVDPRKGANPLPRHKCKGATA